VVISVILARETSSMLMGESATPEHIDAIREAVAASNLGEIIHLRTMHLGPEDVLVTAKVAVTSGTSIDLVAERTDDAEQRIRAAVPGARLIFIEPDVRHALETSTPSPEENPS
jgi:divalent metal cation (Fe/Co/Zn/Cd) transporter